ncbi:hypothetical protein BWR19_15905 [Halomonas sp. 1513]|nr:hypothetical protein BWR19_15905 [Halomonas sp. 1513]
MPLANRLRDVLAPMDRHARAILAAAIDDAFETAKDAKEAQQEVAKLLGVWIPKQPRRGSLAGRVDWIDWIADRCPLVPEDRRFICVRLRTLPPKARERAARRYVATWQEAAEAEPKDHCKTNRGRCAANRSLLALIR